MSWLTVVSPGSAAPRVDPTRTPSRALDAFRLYGKVRRLALTSTADPTGGTWTITVGGATTGTIAWNAAADGWSGAAETTTSVRYLVQAQLNTLTGNSAGWRVAVTGGTWPKVPYTLWLWNTNPTATIPAVTIDVSGLTGGTSVVGLVTDPIIAQTGSSVGLAMRGEQLLRGDEAFKTGEYAVDPVQTGAYSVDGKSWYIAAANTGGTPYAIWNIEDRSGTDIPYDMRENPAVFEIYNPLGNVASATIALSFSNAGTTNADCGFSQLNPGYQECICDGRVLPAGTTVDLSAIKSVRFTGATHSGGNFFDKDSKYKMHVGAVSRIGKASGRTTVSIIYDDHLATAFQTYLYAFREFSHIPIGVACVRDWAISGSRSTGANPPGGAVLTLAQLQTLFAHSQFRCYSHSLRHERYGTAVDWESTATTATDQSIEFATNVTPADGTTMTLTIAGVGTTAPITVRTGSTYVSPKTIGDALVALLGAGSVESCSFGFSSAARLSAQTSIRVQFATAQPIMTVTITAGTANSMRVGPSYTPERIAEAYLDNAAYFRDNGIACPDDIWILPQGNIHPRVIEAANNSGVKLIRGSDAQGGNGSFGNHRFRNTDCTYRCVPTRALATGTTTADNVNGLIQELMYCVQHGRSITLMGHGIIPSGTGSTDITIADFRHVMTILSELDACGAITLMFPDEQVKYLESVAAA